MAWFRKQKSSANDVVQCGGCGRKLSVGDFNMLDGPSPGTSSTKIHKTVDRNQPWYKLFCPHCRHWTIRAPA